MLIELASHNPDLKRLLERGYALRKDGAHLVVRRVPYLDHAGALQTGAFVAKLEFVDRNRVTQDNHQVWFAGSTPYGLDGKPVPNMGESVATLELSKADIVVERRFSNKPSEGFADFFAKIEHYMNLVGGPAIAKYGVNPFTFEIDPDETPDSVFLYHDTLSSRAEIGDLSAKLADDVVAVIGLGGTGSYLVDFLAKTPIRELRGFDHDAYHVHNAFRSPGRLLDEELGRPKADVLQGRYTSFRKGILLKDAYLDRSTAPQLDGVTFAFVSVDKGSARKEIFDILAERRIPFIDVGMGLDRKRGPLSGQVRTTYYSIEKTAAVRDMGLAEIADDPEDEYRAAVQIAELNAMNAAFAVIRYKQVRGFYVDDLEPYHLLFALPPFKIFSEA